MYHYDDGPVGSGGGVALIVIMTMLTVAVIVAVGVAIWIGVHGRSLRSTASPASSAESTLGERFARGELDETEYRRRMATLRDTTRTDKQA